MVSAYCLVHHICMISIANENEVFYQGLGSERPIHSKNHYEKCLLQITGWKSHC